jgi:hypothetical protein
MGDPLPLRWPAKDPDELLDYSIDWTARLAGDTLSSVEWILPNELIEDHKSQSGAVATIWLGGGTLGIVHTVTCRVTTAAGRIMDQSALIKIMPR